MYNLVSNLYEELLTDLEEVDRSDAGGAVKHYVRISKAATAASEALLAA